MIFNGKVIPDEKVRYETVGDWLINKNTINVTTADLGKDDYNFLVLIHELVEAYLCKRHGIPAKRVEAFDKSSKASDPGSSKKAPYHDEHNAAILVERILADELEVDWDKYEKALEEATEEVSLAIKKKQRNG